MEPVGPNGEIIIDYSIHDAIVAGFKKIIFVIRHDIEADFKEVIGDRISRICTLHGVEISYAYQELFDVPIAVPEGRTKPWGTEHAVLSCMGLIDGPFAVINADDYYGKNGFKVAAEFLNTGKYGLIGYILKNTLSDNGGVTRGICSVENGKLVGIEETKNIVKSIDGAEANGRILNIDSLVSMNFWCYPKEFLSVLAAGFPQFLNTMEDSLKDEYLLPVIADGMLKSGVEFTVLPTTDSWFGVTYREDKASVIEKFKELYKQGSYNYLNLYSDLSERGE